MLTNTKQLAFIAWLCLGGATFTRARAQTSELSSTLTIKQGSPGCIEVDALRKRIAQYLAEGVRAPELTIEVDLERVGFRVLRSGRLVAERRFERAPQKCAERRDALAFAIALAIEQAESEPAPAAPASARPESSSPPPSGARVQEIPARADSARSATDAAASGAASAGPSGAPPLGGSTTTPAPRGSANAATDNASSPGPREAANTDATGATSTAARVPSTGDVPARAPAATPNLSPPPAADEPADVLDESEPPDPRTLRPQQRWGVHAGASYQSAVLHTPSFLFSLGGELALQPALRVGVSALISAPDSTSLDTRRVRSQLYGGEALMCLNAPVLGMLAVGCAGIAAALVRAEGDGFTRDYCDEMSWISGFARAALEFPAKGSWAGRVFADVRANLLRPELHVARMSQPDLTLPLEPWGAGVGAQIILRLD